MSVTLSPRAPAPRVPENGSQGPCRSFCDTPPIPLTAAVVATLRKAATRPGLERHERLLLGELAKRMEAARVALREGL